MRLNEARVIYLTAGAAGMYCGSCLHDNAVTRGLMKRGVDIKLLPLYTPIRTDEEDVSVDRVFFGGINVFLQQKIPLFRHLPGFFDRWLNNPALIARLTARAVKVDAKELGGLALSMARGESGYQRKEVMRLMKWLREEGQPDLVVLSNLLIGGIVPLIKKELGVPVVVNLQGDDVFLNELIPPYKEQVLVEMKRIAAEADGFLVFNEPYAAAMGDMLEIPTEKFRLTKLGIDTDALSGMAADCAEQRGRAESESCLTVASFARLCPEKGLDLLVQAFIELKKMPGMEKVRLKVGGWLMEKDRDFLEAQEQKLRSGGLADQYEVVISPDSEGKRAFFPGIDVFSVPSVAVEPKGLSVLEAMTCAIPVVEPEGGGFAEVISESGGGLLFPPGEASALATELATLLRSKESRLEMGAKGRQHVIEHRNLEAMTDSTAEVLQGFL
ncbi:MAG: glycosyltransferase family 4 protein [Verrucomicrobiales bacterium]|nr:glycosyltransferase family 4 protein [Verrucomicrobiales bacterium]